jgi:hypothetical protein
MSVCEACTELGFARCERCVRSSPSVECGFWLQRVHPKQQTSAANGWQSVRRSLPVSIRHLRTPTEAKLDTTNLGRDTGLAQSGFETQRALDTARTAQERGEAASEQNASDGAGGWARDQSHRSGRRHGCNGLGVYNVPRGDQPCQRIGRLPVGTRIGYATCSMTPSTLSPPTRGLRQSDGFLSARSHAYSSVRRKWKCRPFAYGDGATGIERAPGMPTTTDSARCPSWRSSVWSPRTHLRMSRQPQCRCPI